MGIQRNEVAEPQWESFDYAKLDKKNLFSEERWKRTINWNLLIDHVQKTEGVSQLLDGSIYPSKLFSAYIDILEANLYILMDIFYYETGIKRTAYERAFWFAHITDTLRFWNLDWHKEMKLVYEGLNRIGNHLINCLKKTPLSEIANGVFEKCRYASFFETTQQEPHNNDTYYNDIYHNAFTFAYEAYKEEETDKNDLVNRIANMVNIIYDHQDVVRFFVHGYPFRIIQFYILLPLFRQSERGESYIRPWRRDFDGSRDSLIVKMEKDPELGPWVNRYTHLRVESVDNATNQLFWDDGGYVKNEEEALNTDNWIRLLTIAAVLQEYDEQHQATTEAGDDDDDEDEPLLLKLSLYFKDEDTAQRFLKSVKDMNDTEIITLVKKYRKAGLCTDTSKALWRVLHDAKLYAAKYSNWNGLLNKP